MARRRGRRERERERERGSGEGRGERKREREREDLGVRDSRLAAPETVHDVELPQPLVQVSQRIHHLFAPHAC